MSHNALEMKLNHLIKYLEPGTKEFQKTYAIQKSPNFLVPRVSVVHFSCPKYFKTVPHYVPRYVPIVPSTSGTCHSTTLPRGDVLASAFPVKIDKEETIDELKDVIKEEIDVPDAKGLKICKVEIPDDNDETLANLLLNDRD
ncbi:8898_t:CDS:2 [Funneliformis mosseae]|uniref:8898_t:CDS:1 n=1 Tax=Funneliformis mosseae TaxID=27381 RepID=A0A9N9BE33_FUNMO|nr:8898_t:CDS:2 [Funneliformis mosseae]